MSSSSPSPSPSTRLSLYPEIEPYDKGFLKVDDIHTIFYEQCGNPTGKPAVVLHGGPGGGIAPYYRQFFDPSFYRIILLDQRGSGQSTPIASLINNTTWHLVEDIEKLRQYLKIDKWQCVFGGSWGSTLALSYAETYPERCMSLALRGIFMLRKKEIDWFYQEGASFIFPDAWEKFVEPIPPVERHHLLSAYHRRLNGDNEVEKLACAKAWSIWEMTTSRLFVDPEYIKRAAEDDQFAIIFARIETHYFVNGGFFREEDQLLNDAHKIKHIPTAIVQGRYDVVCPMVSAWELHKKLPSAKFCLIDDAGHSAKEDGIISELVKATEAFKSL